MFSTIISFFLIGCIKTFRPLLGPATCRYSFTCTEFAVETLKQYPLLNALKIIALRLLSCNPFTK